MKKVLIASTALMMIAGAAAAEVAVSGSARMGIVYDGSDALFSSRVRIVFTATGETDGGLSFGASMRADQVGGNGSTAGVSNGLTNGDSTVYIKGAFGKLTMGDVGGAPDALVGQVSGVGYGPYDDVQEIGFIGTVKTAVYYEYSTGAFTFGVGAGQNKPIGDGDLNVAVKYAGPNFTAALGYETHTAGHEVSASGSGTFGGATIKAKLADSNTGNGDLAAALSVDFAVGGATITAYATQNRDFAGTDTMGIGAAYDLGGGATFAGGVQDNGSDTIADVGVKFTF